MSLWRISLVIGSRRTLNRTTNYAYNALDHLTSIDNAGQVRTMAYDGYGRLSSRTTPEQGTMTYLYYADDTTYATIDARGAVNVFTYDGRHQVTAINHGTPGGVAPMPDFTFGYDAAGNRTSMSDGLGSVSYGYDQLSRLTSETRTFGGLGS